MPWTQVNPQEEKMRFVVDWMGSRFDFTELCARYHVSRRSGYVMVHRFVIDGAAGFEKRTSRPHSSPNRTATEVEKRIVDLRHQRPTWGPKKLLAWLHNREPLSGTVPARSTVCEILKRNGCIEPKRRRVRRSHPGFNPLPTSKPNDVWTVDFKGEFRTNDGQYCYPLTVVDNYSRYILKCEGMLSPSLQNTKEAFHKLFKEYGLPSRIRSDNGTPFATTALGRLSRLSAWWVRLGILPELIEPSSPQQNGAHERMHKTLKQETTRPPQSDLRSQQRVFDRFCADYNNERPHEALNYATPASLYTHSERPLPMRPSPIIYPPHFEVRLVSTNAGIRWNNHRVLVSSILSKQYIGLEAIDDRLWDVFYGPIWLGRLDEDTWRIIDHKGQSTRKKV